MLLALDAVGRRQHVFVGDERSAAVEVDVAVLRVIPDGHHPGPLGWRNIQYKHHVSDQWSRSQASVTLHQNTTYWHNVIVSGTSRQDIPHQCGVTQRRRSALRYNTSATSAYSDRLDSFVEIGVHRVV